MRIVTVFDHNVPLYYITSSLTNPEKYLLFSIMFYIIMQHCRIVESFKKNTNFEKPSDFETSLVRTYSTNLNSSMMFSFFIF
jgi:hypothetical protein